MSGTKRDEKDDCRPGGKRQGGRTEGPGRAREKRGVMSSAFAQPLTGFIRVGRVCACGLVESPPV